jgi:hypothetical protein
MFFRAEKALGLDTSFLVPGSWFNVMMIRHNITQELLCCKDVVHNAASRSPMAGPSIGTQVKLHHYLTAFIA